MITDCSQFSFNQNQLIVNFEELTIKFCCSLFTSY